MILSTITAAPFGLKAILVIAACLVLIGLYAAWITRDTNSSDK